MPDFGEFPPDETEPASAEGLLAPVQQPGEGEGSVRFNLGVRRGLVAGVDRNARVAPLKIL